MKYPEELVHAHGAKSGLLRHVAQHLPDIPMQPFVTKSPAEDGQVFIKRLRKEVPEPYMFRSSAVEELVGFEGAFPSTEKLIGFEEFKTIHGYLRNEEAIEQAYERYLQEKAKDIEESPRSLVKEDYPKGLSLPDRICVMGTQYSSSEHYGTLVRHPNREEEFWITFSPVHFSRETGQRLNMPKSTYVWNSQKGFEAFTGEFEDLGEKENSLLQMMSWHDEIAALPGMDSQWTYQIEFGMSPSRLYQVRPFKKKSLSEHTVVSNLEAWGHSLVMGRTASEGSVMQIFSPPEALEIERYESVRHFISHSDFSSEIPQFFVADQKYAGLTKYLPHLGGCCFSNTRGVLEHDDVNAMRRSEVTLLYHFDVPQSLVKHGKFVRVFCGGNNVRVEDYNSK